MAKEIPIGEGIFRIIADANKATQDIQNFRKQTESSFKTLTNIANAAGIAVVANYAVKAVKALIDVGVEAIRTGEKWHELSQQTGIAAEQLSTMSYAAAQSGTDITALANGLKFLSRNAYDAMSGTGDAAKAFDKLGVSVRDSGGNLKSSQALLIEVATAFKGVKNETEQTALALQIFGRSGTQLIPLLKEGGVNIQLMEQRAREMGLTWSNVDAAAADRLSDALLDLGLQFNALKDNAIRPIIPEMADFVSGLSAAWKVAREIGVQNRGGILQQTISGGRDIAAYLLGLNQIKGVLGEIADFGRRENEYNADVAKYSELIQKALVDRGFIEKEINKDLEWRKGVDEHAKAFAESYKIDLDEREKKEKAINDVLAARNAAQKAAMEAQYYAGSDLRPGQAGAPFVPSNGPGITPGVLTPFDTMDLSNGLDLIMPKLLNLTDIYIALNDIKQNGIEIDKNAQQAEFNKVQAGIGALGSLAQGMGAINENSKSMFKFQQGIQMVQGIMDAYSAWAAAGRQGGIYGFALGAAIFARIMAFVAILKSQKAPEAPKMTVPGAAEGGVVFKPNIIAIAEKEPEIVMPLSRAERGGFLGGGNTKIEVSFKDMADWERNIAVKLVKRARAERLDGWGFAGA